MKKICFRLITLLLICLIGFSIYPGTVKAETKEYSVLSAEFEVNLLENCDAEITEVWQVRFEKGSFSRFYRDFYTEVGEIEKFDSVEINEVSINGVSCVSSTGAEDRTDNTYWFDNGSEKRLSWFKASKNETVEYKAKYTLHNVVKQVDTGNAVFVYRFIGANFDKPVDSVKTTITGPDGAGIEIGYAGTSEYTLNDNTVIFTGKRSSSEVLKYNVHLPGSAFASNGTVLSVDDEKSGANSDDKDDLFSVLGVCCIELLPVALIVALIMIFSPSKKAKRLLKKDPEYCRRRAADFERAGINPLVYYKWFKSSQSSNMIWSELFMQLTLMIRDDKISLQNDAICFELVKLDDFDRAILEWFKQNCQHDDELSTCTVYPNNFEWLTYDSAAANGLNTLFGSFVEQNYKRAVDAVHMTKVDRAAFNEYFKQNSSYYSVPSYKYFQFADIAGKVNYMLLMYMTYSCKLDFSTDGVDGKYYSSFPNICPYYVTYDESYVKAHTSSSSSSGCSSCSSCGGCGGGGAD